MGYRLRARLAEHECPAELAPHGDGEEPLRVTVRTNLTFDELDALPSGEAVTYGEIFEAIAPYVTGWNLMQREAASGEERMAVPPAEAGPEAFRALPPEAVTWVLERVQTGYLGGAERKKRGRRRGDTGGRSGDGSAAGR